MTFTHKHTGPVTIVEGTTDNPESLMVKFDGIDPITVKQSERKMKDGGELPHHSFETRQENTINLLNKNAMGVTSQTTKTWPTTEYSYDLETVEDFQFRNGIEANFVAADGKPDLADNLAICDGFNLVDCSLAKAYFSDEDEFNVFFQTLQEHFYSSISNNENRFVDEDITRIRLPDKKRNTGSQGGFRVTVWKALDIENVNFNYYVLLKVDRRTLENRFPEKAKMKALVDDVKKVYKGVDLAGIVAETLNNRYRPVA